MAFKQYLGEGRGKNTRARLNVKVGQRNLSENDRNRDIFGQAVSHMYRRIQPLSH